ncbi:AhpC/TSA family protein [Tenacibaculum mesophilum]|uniref:TlpA family protein disulfide reductase n=1 Tax=Tenacibaculum mesophilum TaxID=104268 RepID=A0ABM7CEW4_9FLAO|nr:TlpA disulfide reductase family protein [Tenacibaculum mesophilum]AZJ32303.1 TlpA family protein disulfide reductase [Tenacibaculum mesophilum]QFS27559.1 redoxin domain-containing protein [Tenacibaculum mesophilum]SHG11407.1 AhpC/TSA family protein [Tenacibaculum mesophilum]
MHRSKFLLILIITAFFSGTTAKAQVNDTSKKVKITTLNYEELKPFLHKSNDKTYVVNFWATWCMPCVKELPAFEKLHKKYKDKNVEVVLVSLDFSKQIETNLIPFIKKKKLQSKILHFEDSNEQFWIRDIAESWSGSIPATLIYNKQKRKFYERTFSYVELQNELQTFLN